MVSTTQITKARYSLHHNIIRLEVTKSQGNFLKIYYYVFTNTSPTISII